MTYLVTNRLTTSLVIEDIGVRLNASGSHILQERSYRSSRQLQEYERKKWVTIIVRNSPVKSFPIWPFSAPAAPPAAVVETPAESSVLQSLVARLEGLINSLQGPRAVPAVSAAPVVSVQAEVQTSDEPMFIPSRIVPTTADVNISVKTSESEDSGYDAGLQALKSVRKRK